MKKPAKGSGLNPCLQPDGSQLGIPNEFTQDPSQASQPILLALHEEPLYETSTSNDVGGLLSSFDQAHSSPAVDYALSSTTTNSATSSSTANHMSYICAFPSSSTADCVSYNYTLPSSMADHMLYLTTLAHMIVPWEVETLALPSTTSMRNRLPEALMGSHYPAGDTLPFCEAPGAAAVIRPMCLPTPTTSQYPWELSLEASQRISQIARPSPYPTVSSGIRRVFAYGPKHPSETECGVMLATSDFVKWTRHECHKVDLQAELIVTPMVQLVINESRQRFVPLASSFGIATGSEQGRVKDDS
ncbi:hypothetical protein BKA82DRAFT_4352080 [Pisolithus tinctorius]|nr:hypothetical protein BKA82DRAFT_4352080 [Pisolithus tinctorius]